MEIPDEVSTDEKVAHSIKGGGLNSALHYRRIFNTLLSHVRERGEMSVDRVSLAEQNDDMNVVIRAAEWRTRNDPHQDFQGWAVMEVSYLERKSCEVKADKIIDDPEMPDDEYHANVSHPEISERNRAGAEGFVRELMKVVCWKPSPKLESQV